jgi:hypothetical protein
MTGRYAAKICEVPGQGIRFEPDEESAVPSEINATHLLVLGIALALGRAGYDHHPTPRDPAVQTLEGVLNGEAVLPWQLPPGATDAKIICDIDQAGAPRCRVISAI